MYKYLALKQHPEKLVHLLREHEVDDLTQELRHVGFNSDLMEYILNAVLQYPMMKKDDNPLQEDGKIIQFLSQLIQMPSFALAWELYPHQQDLALSLELKFPQLQSSFAQILS